MQKIDAQGRAYATGKRKNAVARVWIKPGSGKILVNTKTVEVFFARPVLRMLIQQPLVAANRAGQYDVTCTVSGGGLSGQAGAVRHGISKALTYYEPDLRGALKKRRLPHPRLARGRAQEVRQGQSPALVPVLQTLIGRHGYRILKRRAERCALLCIFVRGHGAELIRIFTSLASKRA